tara:strand:+ start:159 stop:410 length:252 start_codon:yes stop_codon:yes gene_type:complete
MNDNKLIAEFMGVYFSNQNYHTSWDWLMPVITVCKNVDADWINENGQHLIDEIDDALTCCHGVEEACESVVNFIKEYNKFLNQ